jgi:hypothetical protein
MRDLAHSVTACVALAVVMIVVASCSTERSANTPVPSNLAAGLKYAQVGRGDMSDRVTAELFAEGAEVQRVESISDIEDGATPIFDGEWLAAHRDSQDLSVYIASTVDAMNPVVAVGGWTSELYDALGRAKAFMTVDNQSRSFLNSTSGNPPIQGFATPPNGDGSTFNSHFASNATTPEGMAQRLLEWQGGLNRYAS